MLLTTLSQSLTAVLTSTVTTRQLPITGVVQTYKLTGELSGLSNINAVTADAVAATIMATVGTGPGDTGNVLPTKLVNLQIRNADTAAAEVTITFVDSAGTNRDIFKVTLAVNETLCFAIERGWYVATSTGAVKSTQTAGSANQAKQVLIIPVGTLVLIADTNTYRVAVPYAFTVLSARFVTDKPATTSSKLTTLTLSTTGGSVTGGVMALTSATCTPTGNPIAATAISGANASQSAGAEVIITASSTTAFVEGTGHVEVVVSNNA